MKLSLRVILSALGRRLAKLEPSGTPPSPTLELLPLTPRYMPEQHEDYVVALEAALSNQSPVLNIALSGSYGVGKSSILGEVARRHPHQTVFISLSSLGFSDDDQKDRSEPGSKTNRIQKEIVKQILYSQDPVKMAGSRYRRMTRFRPARELTLAALLAIPVSVAFYLAGWTKKLSEVVPGDTHHTLLAEVAVFAVTTLLTVGLRVAFRDRIQVEKISAGSATISLIAKSTTYFDEYLDEIVYFFETRKPDIVIFEDIDRFDNAHIFETLRSMNTLLNGAQQLRGRRVRFIYAIKDSIFDELGTRAAQEEQTEDRDDRVQRTTGPSGDVASGELARANRTKFFDLVVPVVPFITHRSARDVLVQTLEGIEQNVSSDLIDLAARYVADMRLILDIRNEFVIFKKRIIDSGDLTLSQDALLAMMLYKSTHLTDFEKIRVGTSDIDDLYRDAQELINQNVRRIDDELRSARTRLRAVRPIAPRSSQFGSALNSYLAILKRLLNVDDVTYTFSSEAISVDDLSTDAFWQKVATIDTALIVSYYQNYPSYGRIPTSISIDRADLARIVSDSLESDDWRDTERRRLEDAIKQLSDNRAFLIRADMDDLISRPEFKLEVGDASSSLLDIASSRLKSDLAKDLVTAGYIDRNFTLYTSTFYSQRVSGNAMNFLMKNVDRNTASIDFQLSSRDVETLVRERGRPFLDGRASYNVNVLDYLLTADPDRATGLLTRLTQYDEEEKELLLAYMQAGSHHPELVHMLTPIWPNIFVFLVSDAGLEDESLRALIDSALESLNPETAYASNEVVVKTFQETYDQLSALTESPTTEPTALLIARFFTSIGFLVPVLSTLSEPNRRAVVETGAYLLSRDNLQTALDDESFQLSLDGISALSDAVYNRVLGDLPSFISILDENEWSIESAEAFVRSLADVADADEAQLPSVIAKSNPECVVSELTTVPRQAWPALAEHRRFPTTFVNVKSYAEEFGIDRPVAQLLSSTSEISSVDDATQEAKLELAEVTLEAGDVIPDADLRAKLIADLSLESRLAPDIIPQEEGRLVGALLARRLVTDTADTFARLMTDDYAGFEYAATQSVELHTFLSAAILPIQFIEPFMDSRAISDALKAAVLNQYDALVASAPKAALDAALRHVREKNLTLSIPTVTDFAQRGADDELVLAALEPNLAGAALSELVPILQSLGDEYVKMTEASGKHATLPDNGPVNALTSRLEELDIVNSTSVENGHMKVNMKRHEA